MSVLIHKTRVIRRNVPGETTNVSQQTWAEAEIFLFSKLSKATFGPIQPPVQRISGVRTWN